MLETEFLFFQGMKKRIDQRISEGNYDEAAVSMQKCMEYILNSLDGRNNDYQKVCVLFEVQARVKDQSVFRTFMGNLYKSLITSAENAKMRSNVQMILFGYPMYGRIEGILEYMEHGKAAGIYTAICTKDWIMRGPADREWLKIKKDNEKYKICRNSDITMYVGLRGFFDIDDGESDPWKDKTYEDFYIGGYFISRYEQDAGIYYKNSKGEKIEDAGCNQYMSKKNPYGIQKT